MFVKLLSGGYIGLETFPVEVQLDISKGLPVFNIVGLADTAVKEAKERVRSAIKNSGFGFPNKRITVNLSPSDRKKGGSLYDLPMALAILVAEGKVDLLPFEETVVIGELALNGEIRPVSGALAVVLGLKEMGFRRFFVPPGNVPELAPIPGVEIFTARSLSEIARGKITPIGRKPLKIDLENFSVDLADVKGQRQAKRALEIAAAGFHHISLIGTPGSGKSMLAARLPTILPPMEEWEVLEVSKIYSVASLLKSGLITKRPFRSPHYSASESAIIGGGSVPKPGEISLAHRGVLFTDELPEFSRKVLETLRQPLEEGRVLISRANYKVEFPAKFLWISALNPCPCGNYKHPYRECICRPSQIRRYLAKISSPLWERIDLKVWVNPVDEKLLTSRVVEETSAEVRRRVLNAVEVQKKRNPGGKLNGELSNVEIEKILNPDGGAKKLLTAAVEKLHLSARLYYKLLRVARTAADLELSPQVKSVHVSEALGYIREPLEV
jgi:magnesium chelatase family protein